MTQITLDLYPMSMEGSLSSARFLPKAPIPSIQPLIVTTKVIMWPIIQLRVSFEGDLDS